MKKRYLAMVISAAMLITACSGGGGGNGGETPKPIVKPTETIKPQEPANTAQPTLPNKTVEPTDKPNTAETTKPSKPAVNPDEIDLPVGKIDRNEFKRGAFKNADAGIGKLSGFNREYSFNAAWADIPNKTVLEVQGKKLLLAAANKLVPFSGSVDTLWNAFKDPERKVVYGGIETGVSSIPTSGKITYKGYAARYDNLTASVDNVGKSTLVADFDNKKISGELAMNGARRNIALKEADIEKNGFSGEAVAGENSVFTTRHGNYEGKFFGPNAEEVAGKAEFPKEKNNGADVKDLNTSFSATAQ